MIWILNWSLRLSNGMFRILNGSVSNFSWRILKFNCNFKMLNSNFLNFIWKHRISVDILGFSNTIKFESLRISNENFRTQNKNVIFLTSIENFYTLIVILLVSMEDF